MKKSNTAERLKFIMKKNNLRQVDILKMCEPYYEKYGVKITKSDLSQYCSGKVIPKQKKLNILSLALNVSEAWLMGFDVPMERDSTLPTIDTINSNKLPANDMTFYNIDSTVVKKHKGIQIPVLGEVAAGIPIEAIEDIIDYEEISEDMSKTGDFFGLRIKGDSMSPRISEGDVVIVRQQNDAESGDIVIVLVNGESATCKRLMKYKNGISLISFNPMYNPMTFSNDEIESKPSELLRLIEVGASCFNHYCLANTKMYC